MARTVVGVAANLCPVDAEGKTFIHLYPVNLQRAFVKSEVSFSDSCRR